MVMKKTLRLATAVLLAGVTLGAARTAHGASPHQTRSTAAGTVAITDWQFPDGCGPGGGTVVDEEVCIAMLEGGISPQPLFSVDNHAYYVPDFAESLPTVANGGAKVVGGNLVVTYKLRPNLRWSDGVALTPNDFIFGTKLEIAAGNTFGVDQITTYKALNSTTLQVTYKGTYAPYYSIGQPYCLPQHYLTKKYGTSDITAMAAKFGNDLYNSPSDVWDGPYKLQSFTTGQSVVMVPNPYYAGPPSAHPRLAQLRFVNISADESGLAAALGSSRAGVDTAEDFQYTDVPVLRKSSYHITVQPSLEYEFLELNVSGALADQRVRQALNDAVNKAAYFQAMFPAISTSQVNSYLLRSPVPNTSPWADKSLPVNQYDPSKAKRLLAAAGYATSYYGSGKHLTLRFYSTSAPIREKSYGILSRYWASVGIHMVAEFPKGGGNGGLFSPYNLNGILAQRRFDVAQFTYSVAPDPQTLEENFNPSLIPTPAKHGNTDLNYMGVTDQQQFNLLVQARTAIDTSQRHTIFDQWQRLESQQVYWIMLFNRANITATNGTIGNYAPNPTSQGNEWNSWEWYKTGAL